PLRRLLRSIWGVLSRQSDDLWGVVLIGVGVLVALGLYADVAGPAGSAVDRWTGAALGGGRFLLPPALWWAGGSLVRGRGPADPGRVVVGFSLLALAAAGLLHVLAGGPGLSAPADELARGGGWLGAAVGRPLRALLAPIGAGVVLVTTVILASLIVTRTPVHAFVDTVRRTAWALAGAGRGAFRWLTVRDPDDDRDAAAARHPSAPSPRADRPVPAAPVSPAAEEPPNTAPVPPAMPTETAAVDAEQLAIALGPSAVPGPWRLPPLQLLKLSVNHEIDERMLDARGRTLEESLAAHGVETRLLGRTVGPTVTRYELELGPGVKVARVTSLQKDIAYAMAAPDIRMLAPIPGRSAIGVEVPNLQRQLVSLGDILCSEEARLATHPLEVGIGRDIAGRAVMESLAAMPHILIAGATGAGKSSCLNSLLTSILLRATPDQVRMILVDPKRVELGQYNGLPHLLTSVVVNPKKAANALAWAVTEMERRTDLLAEVGVRDIGGYNAAYDRGELVAEPGSDFEPVRLPFVLVVVDELNDLMMVAARDVEESICRIAQMGRAFGIHLVIATQRPSVDVITGVIKANIPSRLAFAVSSLADSRVILDQAGAERLVGKGDMLLLTASSNVARRIQGPWVSEEEVAKVVAHWRRQATPNYVAGVEGDKIDGGRTGNGTGGGSGAGGTAEDDDDEMVESALDLVVRSQLGSTSMLQRKLRVGFARAGRIMDLLEQRGVVGPSEGSKARAVLMTVEELDVRQEKA
ncbi:MAG: DNA translocase FtsK, partial [Acidimicrobiales bacterium]